METIDDPRAVLDNALLMEAFANCRMFIRAWEEFESLRRQPVGPPPSPPPTALSDAWVVKRKKREFDLWGYAYTMVTSARRLHGVLWEAAGCRALREKYDLPKAPALRSAELTDVRVALEHAADGLAASIRENPGRILSGWAVTTTAHSGVPPGVAWLRWLDIYTYDCRVRAAGVEKKCDLKELADAVSELSSKLPSDMGGAMFVAHVH
jgi:hypothetical protein